jgi:membrane-bound lytic murein transglycosylase B
MLGVTRRTGITFLASLPWLAATVPALAREPFAAWLDGLRREALARGIAARTLDQALAGIQPIPAVIEADRRQPETRLTFAEYRRRVVSDSRIEKGRDWLAAHRDLLAQMEARYHVPAEVIVALWAVESNFGERQGGYDVFPALATLAHEGRRASFFRRELLSALEIVDRGYIEADRMLGSWAGAMGQNQFMPSTYLGYAVDFDGDGRRNLVDSAADAIGSIANYYRSFGWKKGAPTIVSAEPGEADLGPILAGGIRPHITIAELRSRGVTVQEAVDDSAEATVFYVQTEAGPKLLLGLNNFYVITRYNRSINYAMAVWELAVAVKAAAGR